MKKNIVGFILGMFFTTALFAQDIAGDWYGLLDIGDSQIRVIFHVKKDKEGYSATMDSPDQGAKGIAMDETIFKSNTLKMTNRSMYMTFKGTYDEENQLIKGTLMQGMSGMELKLGREATEREIKPRPQEPKDFPYYTEEVRVMNEKAEIHLSGTLTLPEARDMKKVVILISGSGAQDRNSDLGPLNHRPFLVWSDFLTRKGIGVLRYDDRGVSKSTGDHSTATSADFADDAEAIVKYLKTREDMEGVQIGLMGHSEGGMIAPMVAARNESVDFVVLLAGPGVPCSELLLKQKKDFSEAARLPEDVIAYDQESSKRIYDYIKENKDEEDEAFMKELQKIIEGNVEDYPALLKGGRKDAAIVEEELEAYSSPWLRYFLAYEPLRNLAEMQCPVLAINGQLDLQVSNDENLEGIEMAMKKGRNEQYKIISYENLNHLLQEAETGNFSEYAEIEETINEKVLNDVMDWIKALR